MLILLWDVQNHAIACQNTTHPPPPPPSAPQSSHMQKATGRIQKKHKALSLTRRRPRATRGTELRWRAGSRDRRWRNVRAPHSYPRKKPGTFCSKQSGDNILSKHFVRPGCVCVGGGGGVIFAEHRKSNVPRSNQKSQANQNHRGWTSGGRVVRYHGRPSSQSVMCLRICVWLFFLASCLDAPFKWC